MTASQPSGSRAVVVVSSAQECALDVLDRLQQSGVSTLCVLQLERKQDVAKIVGACVSNDIEYCSLGGKALSATLREFRPTIALCVPELKQPMSELKEVPQLSLRFGAKQGLDGLAWSIWQGAKVLDVSWVGAPGTSAVELSRSKQLIVESCDNAYTLFWKARPLAQAAFVECLDSLLGAAEGLGPAGEIPSVEIGDMPESCLPDWSLEQADRFIRASTFPPIHSATGTIPGNPPQTFHLDNLEQFQRMRQQAAASNSGKIEEEEAQYASDTHWYSNVGGRCVKVTAGAHCNDLRETKTAVDLVPGVARGAAKRKLRMNEPLIGLNASKYCAEALESSWLGVEGPFIKKFERKLAQICGLGNCVAVHSGTAALYGAVKALGVSAKEHRVLCPSFTCAACADAVVHAGGTPVIVDCELDSFGVSAEALQHGLETISGLVGVVIAPCYGVPLRDYHKIKALCDKHKVWLCEDNCESYGASMSKSENSAELVPLGSLADIAVVSVRSEKMIGVGEGGAILSNDADLVGRARWWCSRAPCRGVGLWRVYDHEHVGQNFRLSEMLGAVGLAASENLPVMVQKKRALHDYYEEFLGNRLGVRLQSTAPGDRPVWWANSAILPSGVHAEKVGMKLMQAFPEIEIRPGFYPLHLQKPFQDGSLLPCPNSELLYQRIICLPSSPNLSKEDIQHVSNSLLEILAGELDTMKSAEKFKPASLSKSLSFSMKKMVNSLNRESV